MGHLFLGLILVAAAQCDYASQRKVLQYWMLGCIVLVYFAATKHAAILGWDAATPVVVQGAAYIVIITVTLYMCGPTAMPHHPMTDGSSSSGKKKK
jgi:hypothetical protein